MAPALDAVRLHAAQTRGSLTVSAPREVTRALAGDLDEARVLKLAVRHAARLLDAPYARIWLFDEIGEFFTLVAGEGFTTVAAGATDDPLSASDSLVALALRDDLVNVADGPAHAAWREKSFWRADWIARLPRHLDVRAVLRSQVLSEDLQDVVAGFTDHNASAEGSEELDEKSGVLYPCVQ